MDVANRGGFGLRGAAVLVENPILGMILQRKIPDLAAVGWQVHRKILGAAEGVGLSSGAYIYKS